MAGAPRKDPSEKGKGHRKGYDVPVCDFGDARRSCSPTYRPKILVVVIFEIPDRLYGRGSSRIVKPERKTTDIAEGERNSCGYPLYTAIGAHQPDPPGHPVMPSLLRP